MGVKELWPLLTPYCVRKPINVLRGKVVAIDLAGWVCESLNVVDYFIHPRQYMKNLYFRTCYMLLEGIIPVFVLDGKAPEIKATVIKQRNALQFRGAKPRDKNDDLEIINKDINNKEFKGRTRFNHVLKNCQLLLNCMGIACVQAPGEAEAYCAFLNKNGLVDGIISQDSDCFAYGAVTVYRNFAVSTQGTNSARGGSIDIYDMNTVCKEIDFGQEKIIVLAIFCGCDYNSGITGAGKDSILKLFKKYKNSEILERIKSWRSNDTKYSELEMRVGDKNICSNCGHIGKTISHSKSGCSICKSTKGCLETDWKEEKLIIKAELSLRHKALLDPNFPPQQLINEFTYNPNIIPDLNLNWGQPNVIKFIKHVGKLLQWVEIYCFQKFLPVLTRWQLQKLQKSNESQEEILMPDFIVKKRVVKGNSGYEIVWKDENKLFEGLIPDEQIQSYCIENPKGIQSLWTTVEPSYLFENSYLELVESFLKSKEKTKKSKGTRKNKKKEVSVNKNYLDMSPLTEVTEQISSKIKNIRKPRKGLQLIDKYFYKNKSPEKFENKNLKNIQCSTPIKKLTLSDLENECSYEENNLSGIIKKIVFNPCDKQSALLNYSRKKLMYETVDFKDDYNISKDDLHLLPSKRKKNNSFFAYAGNLENSIIKSISIDDMSIVESLNDDWDIQNQNSKNKPCKEVSYFFEKVDSEIDEFEKSLINDLSQF